MSDLGKRIKGTLSRLARLKVGGVPLLGLFAVAIVLLAPTAGLAQSSYLGTWSATYPASTSDTNAGCNLCHGGTTSTFNSYGNAVRIAGVPPTSTTLHSIDSANSDGDAGGFTNLQEISANAQPGWKPGATNRIYDATGTIVTRTARPPTTVTGKLDPQAAPSSHARRISLRLRDALVARGKVTVSDGFAACANRVAVKIQKRVSGHWKTIKTTTTSSLGGYSAHLRNRHGRYRSLAPRVTTGTDTCSRAVSLTQSH